jgi:hypothetical protein
MHLGAVEDAIASPCPQHTALLKHLQIRLEDDSRHGYTSGHRDRGVDLICAWHGVQVKGFFSGRIRVLNLVLAAKPGCKRPRRDIRVLDREWVDLSVISQWVNDCSGSHEEVCRNPMRIMRAVPDLLVDVKRKCIVKGNNGHRYVALSYRLGNASPFRLLLRDPDTFRKDAVLEDLQTLERLPLTVRHAIRLADRLGYEYIWTDVLCIVHDGPETLADQLNNMSAIYANADMTIVAADGDGTDGILGLFGISGSRDLHQAAFAIRDEHLIIEATEKVEVTNADIGYNSRGWTYQEYIMSPRKLVFMHKRAHWVCQYLQRHESDADVWDDKTYGESSRFADFIRSGHPDLTEISELLSWYNKRDLTYPGDALSAISGLLSVLSRGFGDGFLYGLPENFFEIGLTWRPYSYSGLGGRVERVCRLRRRFPLGYEPLSTIPSEMPSWSWTAWQGGFVFGLHEVVRLDKTRFALGTFCETSPITEWYAGNEPSSPNRRKIASDWYADRMNAEDQGKPLPEGWTRVETRVAFKGHFRGLSKGNGDFLWPPIEYWRPIVYRHQSGATDEPTFWYYPFRMPRINDSTPFVVPEQTRYLFCKTWKASVLLCGRSESLDAELWADDSDLREGSSRIGRVWLHNAEHFEEETNVVAGAGRRTDLIDVVAISRASYRGRCLSFEEDEESGPPKDRVNVLWVKWTQNIAYRVASGYINEEDWRCLNLEEIDLVLG